MTHALTLTGLLFTLASALCQTPTGYWCSLAAAFVCGVGGVAFGEKD